jgi:hypothetical protein
MFYMSRKSSRCGIASATALLSQALLIVILSASIQGAGELVANEYGEIDEMPAAAPSVTEGVATNGSTEAEVASTSSEEAVTNGEEAAKTNASETVASAEGVRAEEVVVVVEETEEEEEEEVAEPIMAEAVVYVFNNDDDTLSITLFIDSELEGTEDVSKEKEKKFGNYELLAGSHNFKISWWDDDTKKTYQEEQVVEIEETTAVTLYTTQNKEPEEFEVSVMLRNDNTEDLEAYLYIDDEYEKQKTAKKESTTDFGKFDLEEGTHELAVRWQDPETNIDYEKRKTIRVDGTDVITFYAPKGMTFDSDEVAASKTATSKTTTSSKTDTTSTKTPSTKTTSTSTTTKDDDKVETSSKTAGSDTKQTSTDSSEAKASTDKSKTSQEKTSSDDEPAENEDGSGPGVMNLTLLLSTIGAILAIYFIFFRR